MTEKEKIIYLAGIVDGEGTFWRGYSTNGRGDRYLQSRMIVVQKDKTLLDWIRLNFGGCITKQKRLSYGEMTWIHRISINGKKCELLAKQMLPYMIVKREQIKRVLEESKITEIPV